MTEGKISAAALVRLHQPENPLPVVFDSPHSGRTYPDNFNHACDVALLEKIEDKYVDDLLSAAPEHGASLLCADFPRTYIDVNRARNDIDENLLERKWPSAQYGAISPTARSDAGIGLISRLIKPGIPIYNRKMGAEEVMHRIMTHYDPYHDTLRRVLEAAYYAYGQYWYIDCHSMPSASAYPKRNITLAGSTPQQLDIVLGDRDGQTCGRDFLYAFRDFWRGEGYRVGLNDPFKGVELVRRYAQPTRGKNTVQLEINRALYLDEATGEKRKDYADFKRQIEKMIIFCTSFARSKLDSMAAD